MTDLAKLTDEKLIERLFNEGDRLSRAVVEEIVRRRMVARLAGIVSDPFNWNEPLPAWWAPVHAVYALGAIGTAETVLPLCRALRYAEACENDWVTEDLPAIFGRIGNAASPMLRTMAFDRTSGWLVRTICLEGLAAIVLRDPAEEAAVFGLIHAVFVDPGEDLPLRQNAGSILLDLLRQEYRADLAAFGALERARADRDASVKVLFTDRDVEKDFNRGVKAREHYERDWLRFYEPDAIAERQRRWDKEQLEKAAQPEHRTQQELCPLAQDKNHRKCCLGKVGLA